MALFGMQNLVFGTTTSFADTDLLLTLGATEGARFSLFPARATMWNFTDFSTPEEALHLGTDDAEIIQIDGKSGDVLTPVQRGLEGIPAISSKLGKEYRIIITATQAQWNRVCRAQPDGLGPFDAILQGTPATIPDIAMARFVKNDFANNGFSIQGSPFLTTRFFIGDTTDPDQIELSTSKFAPSLDFMQLIFKGIVMMRGNGDGGLSLLKPAGPSNDGQCHIGETLTVDKMYGLRESFGPIVSGIISDVETPVIRVTAEGGPGADNLDQVDLALLARPFGSRVIVILENELGHAITVRDKSVATSADPNITLATGTTLLLTNPGDRLAIIADTVIADEWEEIWRSPPTGATVPANYVLVRDEKASGTDGGTFTSGAFQTRDINTESTDTDGLVTISANQFTLQPGTYRCNITAPAVEVANHKIRLQNITDVATELLGHSAAADKSDLSVLRGLFTIASAKTFEVQHQSTASKATIGFGRATSIGGVVEVYTQAEFQKLA